MPKKFAAAKRRKEREEKKQKLEAEKAEREAAEAAGIKLPKKPRPNKFGYPAPEPLPPPEPLSVAQAMDATQSWNAANVIANKFSVGTVTTTLHSERAQIFQKMNQLAEDKGSLYPQSAYFGKDPNV